MGPTPSGRLRAGFGASMYRFALGIYRRLPVRFRRVLVRGLAPSFTVGAICVIERPDGHVLLLRQAYRERWGIPGGLLQRREDPADAARREVLEEVGLEIELIGEPAVVVDPVPQRIDIVYRARPVSLAAVAEMAPRSPEIVETRWFAPDELPELQFETAQALVALARSSHSPQAMPLLPSVSWLDR
ncbi:MAG: NUDIX domain-containing protein, partial [Acidimicrobiales bacterium]|nr:NUDIX domain-containing protein [Acidimicrobiales bacterium]